MTSHPKDISDELISIMAEEDKICNQLHLPVQSGSNRVLELMNRKYTREQYLNIVDKVRAAIPNIVLTTDIIVGFPGETNEDFEDTLSILKEVEYDTIFSFTYSTLYGKSIFIYFNTFAQSLTLSLFSGYSLYKQLIKLEHYNSSC